jgi:transposase
MLVTWAEMPRSSGHVFCDRLQSELIAAGFDGFVEDRCAPDPT